jgi:hypothetical protein
MGAGGLNFPPCKKGVSGQLRARAKGGVDRNRPKIDGGCARSGPIGVVVRQPAHLVTDTWCEIKLQKHHLLRSIYFRIRLINGVFPDGKK